VKFVYKTMGETIKVLTDMSAVVEFEKVYEGVEIPEIRLLNDQVLNLSECAQDQHDHMKTFEGKILSLEGKIEAKIEALEGKMEAKIEALVGVQTRKEPQGVPAVVPAVGAVPQVLIWSVPVQTSQVLPQVLPTELGQHLKLLKDRQDEATDFLKMQQSASLALLLASQRAHIQPVEMEHELELLNQRHAYELQYLQMQQSLRTEALSE
jgi:hypothetical protein